MDFNLPATTVPVTWPVFPTNLSPFWFGPKHDYNR